MTILIWNVEGLNLKERRRDMIDHITNLKQSMVGLVETKVKEHKAQRVFKCLPKGWEFYNNYASSPRGRIWLCWNQNVWKCTVMHTTSQQITVKATNGGMNYEMI